MVILNVFIYISIIGYDVETGDIERNVSSNNMKHATSYSVVNVEESSQGERSVEYFLASDAR